MLQALKNLYEHLQSGFRPGPTQTGLYSNRRWLEAGNLGFRKKRNCTIRVAKTKAPLLVSEMHTCLKGEAWVHGRTLRRFSNAFPQILCYEQKLKLACTKKNQRTIGPENAHLKPDLGVLGHHEMTLTLNTHTPLLTS